MQCLSGLNATVNLQEHEIVLVDDCSTEFQADKFFGPPIKVLRNSTNLGFSSTCNRGALEAGNEILIFLNSDTIPFPGWLEPILRLLENEKVGIVGPKLIFPTEPNSPQVLQSCGGSFDVTKSPYHRYLGWDANDWRINQTEKVSWTTGAVLAIRKSDFMAVGGFDPAYIRGYFEDVDLCQKIKESGKEIWYCHEACLVHSVGKSTKTESREQVLELNRIFMQNSLLFHERWDAKIKPDTFVKMVPF